MSFYLESDAQAEERILNGLTLSVVGCGYIGTCIGALQASRGVRVVGIDSNERLVKEINRGTTSIEEPDLSEHVRRGHESGRLSASSSFESIDRKSTRLNSSHIQKSRMPSSA